MIALVESDELAYRAAFGCQKTVYTVHIAKGKTYKLKNKYSKKQITDHFVRLNKQLDIDYTLTSETVIEPDYHAKRNIDCAVQRIKDIEGVTEVRLFLSPGDKSNFRYNVAVTPGSKGQGYKAGRGEKPVHLALCRERLKKYYGAEEVFGYEADDALGMYRTGDDLLVHIDKDIDMIPGKHYHHIDRRFYDVPSEGIGYLILNEKKLLGGGLKWFYAQMLMGDPTDNIPGIKGVGIVGAYNLLNDCVTEEDCIARIVEQYRHHHPTNYISRIDEIADLLWICRKEGETGGQYLKNRGFL